MITDKSVQEALHFLVRLSNNLHVCALQTDAPKQTSYADPRCSHAADKHMQLSHHTTAGLRRYLTILLHFFLYILFKWKRGENQMADILRATGL